MRKIKIKVLPRSSKNEIVGELPDGTIKIKLKAPPIDGEANTELIKFLSKEWKVSKSSIRILKGKTSKTKLVEID
ncbi:MAG: DUF167 domain-containing protein [Candidatus Magasanikbacteria bacterium]|nr:DUF167 domain-containing protein [Candidatus Magasanikbacteria bacterium]MBT6819699.1 DUF167 domain-containing protein [Candidatus Magasanikbacteria bacterium]